MTGLERGLLTGIAAYRWAALAWLTIVLVVSRDELGRPWLAVALVGLAALVSASATWCLRRDPRVLLKPPAVIGELVVAAALLIGDTHAYDAEHQQSLGSAWPVAGVLTAGLAAGPVAGGVAGVALGLARWFGAPDTGVLSLVSTGVLYGLAGASAGFVTDRLRRAEREIAAARAREEVARTLHDGVLQTLAVVQRRSTDQDLVRLAHEQERDLRAFLFGDPGVHVGSSGRDLGAALRLVAARAEDRDGTRVQVVVADDVPRMAEDVVTALAGAVGEALTNAAKHGGAHRITVYAEPADDREVFCSVKDDGSGFDPAAAAEGVGLGRSIRARIAEVGGRVDLAANPGRGTEVRLWVPVRLP